MKKVTVFLEGGDDKYFVENLFDTNRINLVTYASTPNIKDKISKMRHSKFTLMILHDSDSKEEEKLKEKLSRKYGLPEDDVFIAVVEIESWYAAGVSKENEKKLGLKKIPEKTELFTKEQFDALSKQYDHNDLIELTMGVFDKEMAMKRNSSFKAFYQELTKRISVAYGEL